VVALVAVAIIVAAAMGLAIGLNSASDTLNQGYAGQESSSSSTVTSTSTCLSRTTQDNPLAGFRVLINDSSSWNATATGYSNSTANQVFSNCYMGTGTGWILIDNWNPNGGSILNVTVSKLVGDNGTLTVALGGETANTTAPFGTVKVSEVEVP
jgi:hypothetical protein